MSKTLAAQTWRPVEASGFRRTDWAVHGSCICHHPVESNCDGSCNVPVSGGLSEAEAKQVCEMENMQQVTAFLRSLGGARFCFSPVFGAVPAIPMTITPRPDAWF